MHNIALIKMTPTINLENKLRYRTETVHQISCFFILSIVNKLHHGTEQTERGMCKANIQESWRAAHGSSPGWC